MKIVSWNCNGAFRKKTECIDDLDADILVIQECEDPARSTNDEYRKWAGNYLWVGQNKNKGLGIFARNGNKLEKEIWDGNYEPSEEFQWMECQSRDLQLFLPCRVNDEYSLLGVWTLAVPPINYVGQLWLYIQIHRNQLIREKQILCGDLNSNAIWDKNSRHWNHSDVIKELRNLGLISLYHWHSGEAHGTESKNTFFMYRKIDKPFHIDYAFLSQDILENSQFEILNPEIWLELSDHVPLVFSLQD